MRDEIKILLISIGIVLLATNIPKLIYPTQNTLWNIYYERQVRETFYQGQIPAYDELSYLGRPMTYLPGYFAAKAMFLWLMNLDYSSLGDWLFETFVNAAFVIGLVFLGSRIGLKKESLLIFTLVPISCVFIFTLMSAHLLHVLSLALLTFALGFAFTNHKYREFICGILLGAASIVHAFAFVMFPIIYGALKLEKIKTKNELWYELERGFIIMIIAFIILLVLYSPVLEKYGRPTEALPEKWGWLLHWDYKYIYNEYFLLAPVLIFSSIFGLFFKKTRWPALFVLIGLIALFTITFRVNVIVSFIGAALIARFFENKFARIVILLIILLNFPLLIYRLGGFVTPCIDGYINNECRPAIEELRNMPDSVLEEPLLGHATTFIAEKPVLADLYVEYANEQQLIDAINFEETNNLTVAEKWNITTILTRYSCGNYTKVYDNGYFKICLKDY